MKKIRLKTCLSRPLYLRLEAGRGRKRACDGDGVEWRMLRAFRRCSTEIRIRLLSSLHDGSSTVKMPSGMRKTSSATFSSPCPTIKIVRRLLDRQTCSRLAKYFIWARS